MAELKLKPHQIQAVKWEREMKRAIVADDMGLGKTVEAMMGVYEERLFPCLIIAPSSLKMNWLKEVFQWLGKNNLKAEILDDTNKRVYPYLYKSANVNFFITNYESLYKFFVDSYPEGKNVNSSQIILKREHQVFKSIIIDEAHRVKEPTTKQTKIATRLCRWIKNGEFGVKMVLAVTGTPYINNIKDVITQLYVIGAFSAEQFNYYSNKYLKPTIKDLQDFGKVIDGKCYFRRTKDEVGGLPPKVRRIVYTGLENQAEYDEAYNDLATYLKEYVEKTDKEVRATMRNEALVKVGYLKRIASRGKHTTILEFIKDMNAKGEKVIIFGDHKEPLYRLKDDLLKDGYSALTITGDDNTQERNNAVNEFQNNSDQMNIICSLKAAGVGLTLTAARIVVFIEQGWHPALMNQAEDRAHRISQFRDVFIYNFIAQNTIEERVYKIIERKRSEANAMMNCTENIDTQVEDINEFSILFEAMNEHFN